MFTVEGIYDGVSYTLVIDRTAPDLISGSGRAMALIEQWEGEQVSVTPTGPVYTVDVDDDASILAVLMTETTVVQVGGQAPRVIPPPVSGAVY